MRTILRYPGGKSKARARRWVLGHSPAHYAEYREPFVGGGGIFFYQQPEIARWVNDLNPDLMAVYLALRDRPAEFISACRSIPAPRPDDPHTSAGPKGGQRVNARLKAVFDRLARDTGADPAFRYFFLNRCTFGGRVRYDLPSRQRFTNAEGWRVVNGDALEKAAESMKGVHVTCGDFAPLLLQPGKDVWCYCDPPYVFTKNVPPTRRLYQHEFGEGDHERLADAVRNSPHRVAVSYGDDDKGFVRSLYRGFNTIAAGWYYAGRTNGQVPGRELLILNYEP